MNIFDINIWKEYDIIEYKLYEYFDFIKSIILLGERNLDKTNGHHIIPVSIDENYANTPENIIKLTPREHFVAHIYLSDCFNGINFMRMSSALSRMCGAPKSNGFEATDEEKEMAYAKNSIAMRGENNPYYGRHHSQETKDIISEKLSNPSDETRELLSKAHKCLVGELNSFYGHKHSNHSKRLMSEKHKEYFEDESHRKHLSDLAKERKGDKSPNYNKEWYNDGVKNYPIKIGDPVPDNLVKGFLKKKENLFKINNGKECIQVPKDELDKYLSSGKWEKGQGTKVYVSNGIETKMVFKYNLNAYLEMGYMEVSLND